MISRRDSAELNAVWPRLKWAMSRQYCSPGGGGGYDDVGRVMFLKLANAGDCGVGCDTSPGPSLVGNWRLVQVSDTDITSGIVAGSASGSSTSPRT